MPELTLSVAQVIVAKALAFARSNNLKPVGVAVLDERGALKAAAVEDGTSLKRFEVAHGKAFGALALGTGTRAIHDRAQRQPSFIAAISHVVGGALVPVPGGVLINNGERTIGAIGVSGDISDSDEAAALAGVTAAGFTGLTD